MGERLRNAILAGTIRTGGALIASCEASVQAANQDKNQTHVELQEEGAPTWDEIFSNPHNRIPEAIGVYLIFGAAIAGAALKDQDDKIKKARSQGTPTQVFKRTNNS